MATKQYGLPYKGSKNKIAEWVVQHLPPAEVFVDLFAGGCAVTHAAMLSGKYKRFIINDICEAPRLFVDAVNGKYHDETRWISREEFRRLRDVDTYVRFCWSFGNNGQNYMYSREIEPWKKALHYAAVFNDYSLLERMDIHPPHSSAPMANERKIEIGGWCNRNREEVKAKYIKYWLSLVDDQKRHYEEIYGYILRGEDIGKRTDAERERLRQYLLDALADSGLTQAEVGRRLNTDMSGHYFGRSQWEFPTCEAYKKMQTFMPKLTEDYYELTQYYDILESLQRLESLQSLQSLESLQRHYRNVDIPDGAVVYCDIPYIGTGGYNGTEFDHAEFYEWALRQKNIFISEYTMPEGFECVAQRQKQVNLSAAGGSRKKAVEKIFIPKGQNYIKTTLF